MLSFSQSHLSEIKRAIFSPTDVTRWLRHVFYSCNSRVSTKLSQIPTVHESSLDLTFIESLSHFRSPLKVPSDWIVRIDTHYLGGGRHFRQWEVADIGIVVTLRQAGKFRLGKIALLQSKRLYPDEQAFEEDKPVDYIVGFGRLFEPNDPFFTLSQERRFTFTEKSKYKALQTENSQYATIQNYEKYYGVPVYYLLYNPRRIPWTATIPISGKIPLHGHLQVGCRVLPSAGLRDSVKGRPSGYSPAYSDLTCLRPFDAKKTRAGWTLEHFIVDLIMGCKAGFRAKSESDPELTTVFTRREGPIAAAIGVTIDARPKSDLHLRGE